jgi:signal transduction histidine kinase
LVRLRGLWSSHWRAAGQVRAAAGLDLRLDLPELLDRDLPASVQLTAYRILQEALTNVLKHGDRESVVAVVLATGTELVITVRNRVGDRPGPPPVPSGRNGLMGMRERVALFGGSLSAQRAADDFEVRAVLPLAGHARPVGVESAAC